MKRILAFILAITMMLALCACGETSATATPEPTTEPTPVQTQQPTPFKEPEVASYEDVTFDGQELKSGSVTKDGVEYVLLSEVAEALGVELKNDGNGKFSFDWRKSEVSVSSGEDKLTYLDTERSLDTQPILCKGGSDLYVPVISFCDGAEIATLWDEENMRLYCTPAAGQWEIPQGYTVPVMMYHATGYADDDANLVVSPYMLEEQFKYLTENGYTPIWFEDLWHVEDFEKPVLLTFDDGWANNYSVLYPLLQKYNIKATIFVVVNFIKSIGGSHLDYPEVVEMAESGLVSIQSHTMTHDFLSYMDREEQEWEMSESRLYITRLVGKQPLALAYPTGMTNDTTLELTREYYRFGVKMVAYDPYNTSDDPTLVFRFFPERLTPLQTYIRWLEESFAEDEAETEAS